MTTANTDKQPSESTTVNEAFDGKKKRGLVYRTSEFDHDFIKVYMEQPFLGSISMSINKVADEGAPTAYMGARKEGNDYELTMGFNPDFFRSLSEAERQGVVCHELYHLIFGHITRRSVMDPRMGKLWNIATDLAINSIIGQQNLPSFGLLPGKRPLCKDPKTGLMVDAGDKDLCDFIENAPTLQASDFYFEKMKEIINKRPPEDGEGDGDPTGGMSTLDDHDGWGQIPQEIEEQLQERMRDLLEKAIRHADNHSQSWGSIPAEIQEMIRKMVSREINWRAVVRQFIGRCRSVERSSTLRKVNKRAPYLMAGARRKTQARFRCFIDQSGSMSDMDIALLFGELEGLASETEIEVWHFDTEIDEKSHTLWRKGKAFPKAHRTRCGGTTFQAIADFCNRPDQKGKTDGVFILTDGYADIMGPIHGVRVLWVITPTGTLETVRSGDLVCKMSSGDNGQFKRL